MIENGRKRRIKINVGSEKRVKVDILILGCWVEERMLLEKQRMFTYREDLDSWFYFFLMFLLLSRFFIFLFLLQE